MSETVALTIPRERPFHGIAHLVLGGLALRRNLTLEQLEDLQLALDALLEQEEHDGEVTLELEATDGRLVTTIGPFDGARLRSALERTEAEGSDVGLARVLGTVVDEFRVEERQGASWVRLAKSTQVPTEAA